MSAVTSAPASGAFGQTLRRLREERGLSQARLAEAADCEPNYVSRLESVSRNPSRLTVTRLADALRLEHIVRVSFFADAGYLEHPAALTLPVLWGISEAERTWLARREAA